MARLKRFICSSGMLALRAAVVPQNTLVAWMSLSPDVVSSDFSLLHIRYRRYSLEQESSEPILMKSKPGFFPFSSTSLLHISSTARFVYDSSNTLVPSSSSSSLSRFTSP